MTTTPHPMPKARPLNLARRMDAGLASLPAGAPGDLCAGSHVFGLTGVAAEIAEAQPPIEADHRVLREIEWKRVAMRFALSPREVKVAQRIFDDLRESEIAERLGISPHTVHTHIERLYRKIGVASRSALAIAMFAEVRRAGSLD